MHMKERSCAVFLFILVLGQERAYEYSNLEHQQIGGPFASKDNKKKKL